MKFQYYNDTNRKVNIHPATFIHGCKGHKEPIQPLEERTFILPDGTYPWVKMWDHGDGGLSILISPMKEIDIDSNLGLEGNTTSDFWSEVDKELIDINLIQNRVNADKLFVCLITEINRRDINPYKTFTIKEVAEIIPKGTAEIRNHSIYGFSFMSMLSKQKNRDYFIFDSAKLKDEFTSICNNNHDRDNYYWKKHYLDEKLKINIKYLKQ